MSRQLQGERALSLPRLTTEEKERSSLPSFPLYDYVVFFSFINTKFLIDPYRYFLL